MTKTTKGVCLRCDTKGRVRRVDSLCYPCHVEHTGVIVERIRASIREELRIPTYTKPRRRAG